ncbi:MAG: tRNA (adenosine(37)-N6)-threonylcarbamoyltransferase complex ATPase subunit type 1 TsaE [Acidimicrobiia bacterium]|nr:tRNA (adenosine(37)-N6)-threonylcarbamoyltransferase complex ATPase subunit type 1 TsaE [Actinomycetota bacterium]MBL6924433.1 tRNA (adenosine(37)-N6)-threonylcarbamoyltransferase complex ATPase subunit type 1 TsaE [Acidimicrobiia bacterium]MBL6926203.1 tRNA (adenosine(37)-N6)-threonylcarbamoyltransferase complex ATPase subunit type 1 TsaE [Acidimicrobiia bacterium]
MTSVVSISTCSAEQTIAAAGALAGAVRPGDLIVLCGDLGAGKTAFTQGLGRALGVTTPITSPTFTLANRYEGDLVVNHLDVYRLAHIDEVRDLGLHELLDDKSVTVIEWGDAIAGVLPGGYLEVRITLGDGSDDRVLEFRTVGEEWTDREAALSNMAGPASDGGGTC